MCVECAVLCACCVLGVRVLFACDLGLFVCLRGRSGEIDINALVCLFVMMCCLCVLFCVYCVVCWFVVLSCWYDVRLWCFVCCVVGVAVVAVV